MIYDSDDYRYLCIIDYMDIKAGDKKFKKAKEDITISFTNWSKDYASAASSFD